MADELPKRLHDLWSVCDDTIAAAVCELFDNPVDATGEERLRMAALALAHHVGIALATMTRRHGLDEGMKEVMLAQLIQRMRLTADLRPKAVVGPSADVPATGSDFDFRTMLRTGK